jgi:spermidine synthase
MPQAVKLTLTDLSKTGTAVGTLAAWSAAGNILGTLAGGYFIISLFGTRGVFTVVAVLLLALGVWVARGARIWRTRLSLVVGLFLFGSFIVPGTCRIETNYYCIRIDTSEDALGSETHVLRLDHLVHSYVNPSNPSDLGYDYEQVYANLIASRYATSSAFTAYFIGGGGYVLPRYIEQIYPEAMAIVDEIDPGVTQANFDLLGLSRDTNIRSANEDARMYLARGGDEPYDLVFGDAFNDFSVPYHLTTSEFHRLLKTRMSPDGVYALNIIDDVRYGKFLASMIRTLQNVWTYVYVAPQAETILPGRNTIVLLASDKQIDRDVWYSTISPAATAKDLSEEERRQVLMLVDTREVDALLQRVTVPALTDDYVPTDRYLAPVFSDAY